MELVPSSFEEGNPKLVNIKRPFERSTPTTFCTLLQAWHFCRWKAFSTWHCNVLSGRTGNADAGDVVPFSSKGFYSLRHSFCARENNDSHSERPRLALHTQRLKLSMIHQSPCRTDNAVKNRYQALKRRQIEELALSEKAPQPTSLMGPPEPQLPKPKRKYTKRATLNKEPLTVIAEEDILLG
jgi:hypothetical protein